MKTLNQIALVFTVIVCLFVTLLGWGITMMWIIERTKDKWWAPILGFVIFFLGIFVGKFLPKVTNDEDRIGLVEKRLQSLEEDNF